MLKAAVFDLDGTLCAVGKAILPETLALLEQLQRRGVQLALSSGKPIYYLCGLLRQNRSAGRDSDGRKRRIGAARRGSAAPVPLPHAGGAPTPPPPLTQLQEKLEAEFGPRIWFQPNQTEVTPFFCDETTHADLRTFSGPGAERKKRASPCTIKATVSICVPQGWIKAAVWRSSARAWAGNCRKPPPWATASTMNRCFAPQAVPSGSAGSPWLERSSPFPPFRMPLHTCSLCKMGKTPSQKRRRFFIFAFVVSGHATFALPYTVSVGLFFKSPKIRLHKGEIDLKYTKIIN